jgi:hypothetical protein
VNNEEIREEDGKTSGALRKENIVENERKVKVSYLIGIQRERGLKRYAKEVTEMSSQMKKGYTKKDERGHYKTKKKNTEIREGKRHQRKKERPESQ